MPGSEQFIELVRVCTINGKPTKFVVGAKLNPGAAITQEDVALLSRDLASHLEIATGQLSKKGLSITDHFNAQNQRVPAMHAFSVQDGKTYLSKIWFAKDGSPHMPTIDEVQIPSTITFDPEGEITLLQTPTGQLPITPEFRQKFKKLVDEKKIVLPAWQDIHESHYIQGAQSEPAPTPPQA